MIDRSKTSQALAKAIAYKQCGKDSEAAALIIVQRDIDGNALVIGWHGLGLALLLAFVFALLNFRGALSVAYLNERNER